MSTNKKTQKGPLNGFRVIEMAGIGPNPMCAMMLADMGAEVIRIDRTVDAGLGIALERKYRVLDRSRPSVAVDLKKPEGVETVLKLIANADALIEGFRPGVMERLGLGPEKCMEVNPKLVFGRVTGWGQYGSLAKSAGHDINYISLVGACHSIGHDGEPPVPPLNLIGDFGGGAMLLAVGVLAALLESKTSGQGQVVDAAMTDGTATLMAALYGLYSAGMWSDLRQNNILDGGAHFYNTYETKDKKYISIASIEHKFYEILKELIGYEDQENLAHKNKESWSANKKELIEIFKQKTRDEWCELLEGTDVCYAPVLNLREAPEHPHNKQRQTFTEIEGVVQPSPSPRFSRTPSTIQSPPSEIGENTDQVLKEWGFSSDEISNLKDKQAIG